MIKIHNLSPNQARSQSLTLNPNLNRDKLNKEDDWKIGIYKLYKNYKQLHSS